MDFFKNVTARVGDVAKNVGDLLLESDSDSETDERSETRRGKGGSSRDGIREGDESDPLGGSGGLTRSENELENDFDDDDDDEGPLIPENVWNAFRAAKDRVARVAKTTVASVSRDVAAAAETVRRDLGEFNDTVETDVVFVGDALSEYAAGGAGGLGVSLEDEEEDAEDDEEDEEEEEADFSDSDSGRPRRGRSHELDRDVVETFERTAEALENVGEKVEKFGAAMFQNATRMFDKMVETLDADDADDRNAGTARTARPRRSDEDSDVSSKATASNQSDSLAFDPHDTQLVFETKVAAMQRDSSTYCDEPADAASFARFLKGFDARGDATLVEISRVLESNSFFKIVSSRIVPAVVAHDVFWSRYFFHLKKLQCERDGVAMFADDDAVAESADAAAAEPPGGGAAAAPRERSGTSGTPGTGGIAVDAALDARASFVDAGDDFGEDGDGSDPDRRVFAAGEEEKEETETEETEETETENSSLQKEEEKEEEEEEEEEKKNRRRERVIVSDDSEFDVPGHRRVVSLATDDGTVASDDSLGRDWTRVRDVDSPSLEWPSDTSCSGPDAAREGARSSLGEVAAAVESPASPGDLSGSKPNASDPDELDDLDEDWGMDSE